jgi:transposase
MITTFQDPGNIIAWLEKELAKVEKEGGAVIMMSHMGNIDQCERQFGLRWHALMDRY